MTATGLRFRDLGQDSRTQLDLGGENCSALVSINPSGLAPLSDSEFQLELRLDSELEAGLAGLGGSERHWRKGTQSKFRGVGGTRSKLRGVGGTKLQCSAFIYARATGEWQTHKDLQYD